MVWEKLERGGGGERKKIGGFKADWYMDFCLLACALICSRGELHEFGDRMGGPRKRIPFLCVQGLCADASHALDLQSKSVMSNDWQREDFSFCVREARACMEDLRSYANMPENSIVRSKSSSTASSRYWKVE